MKQIVHQLHHLKQMIHANCSTDILLEHLHTIIAKASTNVPQLQPRKSHQQGKQFWEQIKFLKRANQNLRIDLQMANISLENLSKLKRMQQYEFAGGKEASQDAKKVNQKSIEVQRQILDMESFDKIKQLYIFQRKQNQTLSSLIAAHQQSSEILFEQKYQSRKEKEKENNLQMSFEESTQISKHEQCNLEDISEEQEEQEQAEQSISIQSISNDVDNINPQNRFVSWMRIKQIPTVNRSTEQTLKSYLPNTA